MSEDNLQGLLLPPEAAGFNALLWLSVLVGVCLVAILLWYWKIHKNKPSTIAIKQLDMLIQGRSSEQQANFVQLVSILCQGLNIKRLDQHKPTNNEAWRAFQLKLDTACYSIDSKTSSDSQLFDTLLTEAKLWLRDVVT